MLATNAAVSGVQLCLVIKAVSFERAFERKGREFLSLQHEKCLRLKGVSVRTASPILAPS